MFVLYSKCKAASDKYFHIYYLLGLTKKDGHHKLWELNMTTSSLFGNRKKQTILTLEKPEPDNVWHFY